MSDELTSQDLAAEINAEHQQCVESMQATLLHARRCGDLLIEAKKQVAHGDWLAWVRDNCDFSERTAQAYMRISQRWLELEKTQRAADLSMREALLLLAETTSKAPPSTGKEDKPPALCLDRDFYSTLKWAVARLKYIQSRPMTNLVLTTNWITAVDVCMQRAAGGVMIYIENRFGKNAESWIFIGGHFFDFVGVAAYIIANMEIGKDKDGRTIGIINPLVALEHSAGKEMLRIFGWIDLNGKLIHTPDVDDLTRAMLDIYYLGLWRLCEKTGQPWENALTMSPAALAAILPADRDQKP